jgi:hypothetical protein
VSTREVPHGDLPQPFPLLTSTKLAGYLFTEKYLLSM